MTSKFKKGVLLSGHTTIGLGGKAKYFLSCKSIDDLMATLEYAKKKNIAVQVISGGSNVIFSDEGFDGIVLKIDLKGISYEDEGKFVKVLAAAGENLDEFVAQCIENDLSGIECLSGIPGSVGATPVQNVGAYGQEIKKSIVSVTAINRDTLETVTFENKDCQFDYRESRFKKNDKDKFIITEVLFRLRKSKLKKFKYKELKKFINANYDLKKLNTSKEKLNVIRKSVLTLRMKKSMVIDKKDINTKSCGSFFLNPVLNEEQFKSLQKISKENFPFYQKKISYKIPAAWLVERSGFHKGYRKNGAGISENHSLAIINLEASTKDILDLANEIENAVFKKFNIRLEKEPVIISN